MAKNKASKRKNKVQSFSAPKANIEVQELKRKLAMAEAEAQALATYALLVHNGKGKPKCTCEWCELSRKVRKV